MNFSEIGQWIIDGINAGKDRSAMETQLQDAFDWTENQAYSATDPYFDEKRYVRSESKIKRG